MEETKVIYYVDEEETPYLMKISQSPGKVTLADFKGQLNRPYHKFFFKAMDDDIGVVKEEIADDAAPLPNTNGRVVCWVVTGESSQSGSDAGGSKADTETGKAKEEDEVSIISSSSKASSRRSHRHPRHSSRSHKSHRHHRHYRPHVPGGASASEYSASELDTATEVTTDADTTSCCDTEDTLSRVSASTLTSLPTNRRKVLTKHRPPKMARSASTTTITTTTMTDASMQVLTVTLNMDTVNFLGISIVGQTSEDGAGGIFVGSVMKGGAVAADGRIDTGDMLLEVNGVNFEHMTNDDAVRALREIVQQPGPITLTVAKCWDPDPIMPTFEPRLEPIRPIDPSAWVMHTNQHQDYQYGRQFAGSPTLSTMTSNSSPSYTSSMPESDQDFTGDYVKLKIHTPMYRIAKALAAPNSGLEVKDRVWLKITIPKSFIGSDLVDWLHSNVEGFIDRRHARKYAALMLKHGFVRHTVNKITFSEQCYYVFGNFKEAAQGLPEFNNLRLSDSGGDGDTLGPLPGQGGNWGSSDGEFPVAPYEYLQNSGRGSHSHSSKSPSPESRQAYGSHGSSASSSASSSNQHSSSSHNQRGGHSDNSNGNNKTNGPHPSYPIGRMRHSSSISSSSEFTSVSQQPVRQNNFSDRENDRVSIRSGRVGNLGVAANLAQSRESFQQALDNPCEYFIDVM